MQRVRRLAPSWHGKCVLARRSGRCRYERTELDASTDPLRILVVDDEINIRTMLAMCLEADGHNVIAHSNISDALAEITRHVFDMVFLDVRLGMDNGLDFLPTLLAESPWAKVIVITAYASIDTAVAAMKRGATDYLPKPFDPLQVQLVTRKVAERRQLERRNCLPCRR